ncbi:hypothetical protein [Sphingobium sp.]|uniref:hypothetical protein n=1 Tax=Sphingobium sp. TaxID=1912891 RepID=UPI002606E0D1|nr:hypothetical protein [Sphingobium sp.]
MTQDITPPDRLSPSSDDGAEGRAHHPEFRTVPRRYRHTGWTPERQQGFIAALADMGSVKAAARSVGMTPESAYQLRRAPGAEEFAAAWLTALDHGVRRLEDIAIERAIHGVEQPVYSYGKLVGTRRVYNDRLLMFLLRNRAPTRFTPNGARSRTLQDELAAIPNRPDSPEAIRQSDEMMRIIRRERQARGE